MIQKRRSSYAAAAPLSRLFSFFFQVSVKCSVFLKERKKRKKDKTDKKEILLDTTSQLCSDLTCWPCFPIYTGSGRWPPAAHPYQHPPELTILLLLLLLYSTTAALKSSVSVYPFCFLQTIDYYFVMSFSIILKFFRLEIPINFCVGRGTFEKFPKQKKKKLSPMPTV